MHLQDSKIESGNASDVKTTEAQVNLSLSNTDRSQACLDVKSGETLPGYPEEQPLHEQKECRPTNEETSLTDVDTDENRSIFAQEKKAVNNQFIEAPQPENSENVVQSNLPEVGADVQETDIKDDCTLPSKLIHGCLEALAYGLQRFPQHYKSQYRLAHAYLKISSFKVRDLDTINKAHIH